MPHPDSHPHDHTADAAIIGAGPIGLELAIGLKHAGAEYVHFEAGSIGSTIGWWAPGTKFFSSPERIAIAGVPLTSIDQDKSTREEYLAYLRGVAQQFDLRFQLFTRVESIGRDGDAFELVTSRSSHGVGTPLCLQRGGRGVGGTERLVMDRARHPPPNPLPQGKGDKAPFRARNIILAIGDMHRPRLINVPGEDLPHVSHYLDDPHRYFGRRVLIVGGKNSAVEAALRLYRIGAQVTTSYRGESFDPKRVKYWLRPELEWLINKGKIGFHPRTVVTKIDPDSVELADFNDCDVRTTVAADEVLLLTGYEQDTTLFEQLGVELHGDQRAPRFDLHTMQTNVSGVYVAGTAAAGSQQRARLFIENTHVHVRRIVKAITGKEVPWPDQPEYGALVES